MTNTKGMETRKQTALQQLKSTIKDGIGNMNGQLNDYKSGYKQCLIDIENLIDKQLLKMEKQQHANTWDDSRVEDKGDNYIGKQKSFNHYYELTYGGNN
jgi:hypothetical protein